MPIPKFDSRAKNALASAQQIALQLGHNFIGSEHLLFGIISQPQEGLPFQMAVIDSLSSTQLLEIIRQNGFEKMAREGSLKDQGNNVLPEITQELQNCIDAAIRVVDENNYSYIGIEHLIYGILDIEGSNGQKIMNINQETRDKLRSALNNIFGMYNAQTNPKTNEAAKNYKTKKDSALEFFTTNLNKKVSQEAGFDVFGRDREIDRLIQILTRKNKNNPIIIGEPGVGKTALVEGLVCRINQGAVPEWLADKRILSLEVGNLLSGTMFRGDFEQRIKVILDEILEYKDVVLFIDEIHMVMGAGSGMSQGPAMHDILKPALSRGDISVIGSTTEDEYRKIIAKDKAFERRFQILRLEEPDKVQTIKILKGVRPIYENYHQTAFPDELIPKLVDLSERFITERYFPDKAIDILDESLVRTRIEQNKNKAIRSKSEKKWLDIEQKILELIKQKNEAILAGQKELLEIFENEQKELENVLGKMSQEDTESKLENLMGPESKVSLSTLEKTISEVSGVPMVRISSDIYSQIKDLEGVLKTKIFGQEEAISQVCKTIKMGYTGVSPHKGPIGSFLLLGPTGVGKTELVKVLTEELYGDISKYLLKIDMSEFREKHSMSRLLGAPAGYVGYEDAPQLTSFLKKKPYSVILFDEIEKGHPEMLNILLQMLDEGKVTDAKGETVTCKHALIFMTSNLGRNQLNKFASKIGFVDIGDQEEEDYQAIKKQVMDEVEKAVRPEILGRINGKIVFRPIGKTVLSQVIQKEIQIVQKHMLSRGISLAFDPKVIDYIVNKAKDKIEYGAREVKAMVAENLLDPISEYLLDNPDNRSLEIKIKKDELSIKKSR